MLGPIWIDALCINQNDPSERNSQAGQMGKIYKGAAQVIVWLGKEDAYTAHAIASLQRFKITVEDYDRDPSSGLREYLRCNYKNEELYAMLCFTGERRWFSRLWVVQEAILAQNLLFFWGAHCVRMEAVWISLLITQYSSPGFAHRFEDFLEVGIPHSRKFFETLLYKYDGIRGLIGWNVHFFQSTQSSDPRDKVFGLLAISG
jgi:hypothetical protein